MTSFHQLYQRYAGDVYRFVYWLSGSADEAEELTAETFLRAFTAGELRVETVKAYLLTIARNLHLQRQRTERRRGKLEAEPEDPTPGPDRVAESRRELDITLRELRALPELTRAALLLHVEEGLPYSEVSRALGISEGAVKVRVHRARLRLATARQDKEKCS